MTARRPAATDASAPAFGPRSPVRVVGCLATQCCLEQHQQKDTLPCNPIMQGLQRLAPHLCETFPCEAFPTPLWLQHK